MAYKPGKSSGAAIASEFGGRYAVNVIGLREFRKALKAVGPEWPKELSRANREIAKIGERVSQTEARGMGGVQARAANAIKGSASAREARIQIKPSSGKRNPTAMANTAFWGAKKRTGWYRTKPPGKPQHPEWVGNRWEVADLNSGPYAINAALARHLDDIVAAHRAALDRLAAKAFTD
jgi:hypothetical protein